MFITATCVNQGFEITTESPALKGGDGVERLINFLVLIVPGDELIVSCGCP